MNTQPYSSGKSIGSLLNKASVIAVIGLSSNPWRTSNHIGDYLKKNNFRIIPVNPNEETVLGEKSFDSMSDLPDDLEIDVVNIFRNKKHTAEVLRDIIEWSRKTGQKPLIWTQLDVSSDEAKTLAEENGFDYVENRCLMVEHSRLQN